MIRIVVTACALAILVVAQDPKPPKAEVDKAVAAISDARKGKDMPVLARALSDAIWIDDPAVAKAVRPLLGHEDENIAKAAVRALRYHDNKESYKVLVKAADLKSIRKTPEVWAEVILALGQGGHKKAISPIVEAVRATRDNKVRNAAAMAMAHIRHRESVDAAIKLITSTGQRGGGRRKGGGGRDRQNRGPTGPYLTLHFLTIKTLESEPGPWKKWWKQHRSTFRIPRTPAGVSERLERRYERTWRLPSKQGEPRRRRDRFPTP